jgi:hypothetical protein
LVVNQLAHLAQRIAAACANTGGSKSKVWKAMERAGTWQAGDCFALWPWPGMAQNGFP